MAMKAPFKLIFLVLAMLMFALAAVLGPWAAPAPYPYNSRLIAGGLFFWSLSELVAG